MKRTYRLCACLILALTFVWPTAVGKSLPKTKPEKVGLSSERLKRIDAWIDGLISREQLAGAVVLIARRGKIAYFQAYGKRNLEDSLPMRKDTIFRIASMTKPITTAAVMMLHEEARLMLNDPIHRHIPAFQKNLDVYQGDDRGRPRYQPQQRAITIRHLLTHTSGFTYGYFGDTPVDRAYLEARLYVGDLQNMVEKLADLPLLFQPGEAWNYSVSTDVLGRIVEIASGESLADFFDKRMFKPLDMRDTGFFVPEAKVDRVAVTYQPKDPQGGLEASAAPTKNPWIKKLPRFLSGGGGLFSTAMDYLRFCQMLLDGGKLHDARLLSPKTVQLMTTNQIGEMETFARAGYRFGLGFSIHADPGASGSLESTGTYSWGGIYNTTFFIDPEEELIGIAMSQLNPYGHLNFAAKFRLYVYQSVIKSYVDTE